MKKQFFYFHLIIQKYNSFSVTSDLLNFADFPMCLVALLNLFYTKTI